jgi:hypothetical protein
VATVPPDGVAACACWHAVTGPIAVAAADAMLLLQPAPESGAWTLTCVLARSSRAVRALRFVSPTACVLVTDDCAVAVMSKAAGDRWAWSPVASAHEAAPASLWLPWSSRSVAVACVDADAAGMRLGTLFATDGPCDVVGAVWECDAADRHGGMDARWRRGRQWPLRSDGAAPASLPVVLATPVLAAAFERRREGSAGAGASARLVAVHAGGVVWWAPQAASDACLPIGCVPFSDVATLSRWSLAPAGDALTPVPVPDSLLPVFTAATLCSDAEEVALCSTFQPCRVWTLRLAGLCEDGTATAGATVAATEMGRAELPADPPHAPSPNPDDWSDGDASDGALVDEVARVGPAPEDATAGLPLHMRAPAPDSVLVACPPPPLAAAEASIAAASLSHDAMSGRRHSPATATTATRGGGKPVTFRSRIKSSGYGATAPRKPSWASAAAKRAPSTDSAAAGGAGRPYGGLPADTPWELARSWLIGRPTVGASAVGPAALRSGRSWKEVFPGAAAAVSVHCHQLSGALLVATADGALAAQPLPSGGFPGDGAATRWLASGRASTASAALSCAQYACGVSAAGVAHARGAPSADIPVPLVLSWGDGPLATVHGVGATSGVPPGPWLVLDSATDPTTGACGGDMSQRWRAAACSPAGPSGVASASGATSLLPPAVAAAKAVTCAAFSFGDRFIALGAGNGLHLHRFALDREWGSLSSAASGGGAGGDVEALKRRRHNGSSFRRAAWWAACAETSWVTAVATQNAARSSLVWSAGSDKSVCVYDCGRGAEVGLVTSWTDTHARGAHALALPQPTHTSVPDGSDDPHGAAAAWYLGASVARDGVVAMWDMRVGGRPVARWSDGPHTVRVHACGLAFSPDMRWLAVGSEDRSLVLFDLRTGTPTRVRGAPDTVLSVAWRPHSAALYAGCLDGSVVLATPTPS